MLVEAIHFSQYIYPISYPNLLILQFCEVRGGLLCVIMLDVPQRHPGVAVARPAMGLAYTRPLTAQETGPAEGACGLEPIRYCFTAGPSDEAITPEPCDEAITPGPSDEAITPGPFDEAITPGPSDEAITPVPSDGAIATGPSDEATNTGPFDEVDSPGSSGEALSLGPTDRNNNLGPKKPTSD